MKHVPLLERPVTPMTDATPPARLSDAEEQRMKRLAEEREVVRARMEALKPTVAALPDETREDVYAYANAAQRFRELNAEFGTLRRLLGAVRQLERDLKAVTRDRDRLRRKAAERRAQLLATQEDHPPDAEDHPDDPDDRAYLDELMADIERTEPDYLDRLMAAEDELHFLDLFDAYRHRPEMQLLLVTRRYRPDLLERMRAPPAPLPDPATLEHHDSDGDALEASGRTDGPAGTNTGDETPRRRRVRTTPHD
ncbi:hypothetical protein [Deinococcus pimensis]|uniref:hypothetical protein n=1 Tax=Deinococcus pimensis TaxID=309888 RepID=UPI000485D4EF|nr:hypothetical protein [Deinococcus pimensis]